MKEDPLTRLGVDSGSAHFLAQMRRMEKAQDLWLETLKRPMSDYERIRRVIQDDSASRAAKQFAELETQHRATMRAILAPMEEMRKRLAEDTAIKRM